MVKTTAERQAAYRARRDTAGVDGNGQRRVSMWLSTGAAADPTFAGSYAALMRSLFALLREQPIVRQTALIAAL